MIAVALLAVGIPSLFGIVSLGLRKRTKPTSADRRGIALQTVIIMVVLLVVALAVAGVLLTRGQESVEELERQDIRQDPSNFSTQVLCRAAGYTWNTGSSTCAA